MLIDLLGGRNHLRLESQSAQSGNEASGLHRIKALMSASTAQSNVEFLS